MAASLGDFLQFDIRSHYLAQECHNILHYRVVSITGLAGDYLSVMNTWILDNLVAEFVNIQNSGVEYDDVTAKNLTNGLDFAVASSASVGTVSSTDATRLPSWLNFSFKKIRESLATRNGWVRLTGIAESQHSGNDITVTGGVVADIENAISQDVVIGIATIAEPVILKRPLPTIVPNTHIYSSVGDCIMNTKIGSQGSRKPGVGV